MKSKPGRSASLMNMSQFSQQLQNAFKSVCKNKVNYLLTRSCLSNHCSNSFPSATRHTHKFRPIKPVYDSLAKLRERERLKSEGKGGQNYPVIQNISRVRMALKQLKRAHLISKQISQRRRIDSELLSKEVRRLQIKLFKQERDNRLLRKGLSTAQQLLASQDDKLRQAGEKQLASQRVIQSLSASLRKMEYQSFNLDRLENIQVSLKEIKNRLNSKSLYSTASGAHGDFATDTQDLVQVRQFQVQVPVD